MRIVKEWNANSTDNIVTIYGSSEETKPVSQYHDGSVYIETDTHKIFLFDEANNVWRIVSCACQNCSHSEGE